MYSFIFCSIISIFAGLLVGIAIYTATDENFNYGFAAAMFSCTLFSKLDLIITKNKKE